MSQGGLPQDKKAVVVVKKKDGSQQTLTCHFNPTDYTISRQVSWNFLTSKGKDMPMAEFQGGGATNLTLKLLFDTSMSKNGNASTAPKDVRDDTKHLWEAAYIDKNNKDATTNMGEPPHIIFMWGSTWSFEAVITGISQEFILFSDSGIPLRSYVTLNLTQIVDSRTFAKQNPTSGAKPGKIHTVRAGDRLDLLAQQYYGKPMLWRYIAEHNDIENPRQLSPGVRLLIPELP
jgi:hypothetical protein